MATQQHFFHHPTTTTGAASCYCHCCYTPYIHCHHHHHNPSPPPDPNFHFSTLHQPPQPHLYPVQSHLPNLQHNPHIQECYLHEERRLSPTITSLLNRIASLESDLRRRSSPSSSSHSLRDAAARTIQTHFRAFLLRRSRTLRQLRDLASIKSAFRVLKSSVYEKTQFHYDVLYYKAMKLLSKLESIQGADPMIRNGRKSISRDLNQYLDYINAVFVESIGLSGVRHRGNNAKAGVLGSEKKSGDVKRGGQRGIGVAKLRGFVEKVDKIAEELDESQNLFLTRNQCRSGNRSGVLVKQPCGDHPKVTKNVSFADNGKVYRYIRRNSGPLIEDDRDDSTDDGNLDDSETDLEDDLCQEVEAMGVSSKEAEDEDEEENHPEGGGSSPSSDGKKDLRNKGDYEANEFVFAAPLPVKMETRNDVIGKRRQ